MKNSTENTEKQPISIDAACRIARHLDAVLNDPDTPKDLRQDIRVAVNELFNESEGDNNKITDTFGYIRDCLLADGDNAEAIQQFHQINETTVDPVIDELYSIAENAPRQIKQYLLDHIFEKTGMSVSIEDEPPNITDLSLPELLSAAIKHPDMPDKLRVDLWNWFANEVNSEFGDSDSPEWFAAALGIKNYRREASQPIESKTSKIRSTGLFEVDPQLQAAKPIIDRLIDASGDEDLTVDALVCLLEMVARQRDFERADFINAVQSYAFSWTVGFDEAFLAYKEKLDCSSLTPEQAESIEQGESDEESETYRAATVDAHSIRKLDPMLGKQ